MFDGTGQLALARCRVPGQHAPAFSHIEIAMLLPNPTHLDDTSDPAGGGCHVSKTVWLLFPAADSSFSSDSNCDIAYGVLMNNWRAKVSLQMPHQGW